MAELFKSISGGLARFIFGWMVPSIIMIGLFRFYVIPLVDHTFLVEPVVDVIGDNALIGGFVFAFFVLVASVLTALSSLAIYHAFLRATHCRWL